MLNVVTMILSVLWNPVPFTIICDELEKELLYAYGLEICQGFTIKVISSIHIRHSQGSSFSKFHRDTNNYVSYAEYEVPVGCMH